MNARSKMKARVSQSIFKTPCNYQDDDESDKHLHVEARDRRYSCLIFVSFRNLNEGILI